MFELFEPLRQRSTLALVTLKLRRNVYVGAETTTVSRVNGVRWTFQMTMTNLIVAVASLARIVSG